MTQFPKAPDGKTTDVLSFLMEEYRKHVQEQPEPLDAAWLAGAEAFVEFGKDYLDKNRPVNLVHSVDRNYQVALSNQKTFVIAPEVPSGDLPPAGAISCNRAS